MAPESKAWNSQKGVVKSREDLSSKGKGGFSSLNNNKKSLVTSSNKQIFDSKHKSVVTVSKSEVKHKTSTPSSSKTITKTKTVRGKSEKKVYTLPGQKFDPPEEREPLRIFYESLSKQIPSSEMAEFWMMEHGLLSPERAKKAYDRKQRRQQQLRMGTPIKSPKIESRPESSQKHQPSKNGDFKPKKRINYSSDDDDFIIKHKKARS
ncbi:hypothetical protein CKAN_01142100 [Cinnamomum micranthum f. kanehirae]|uniref:Uncharacterized protein n=1 Tax=Cinnamomum micranthum f. kanehirae TaxID=337451 RepID=A0A443NW33_9MAGN|nr:hypothetical protein CKAN_01142100 [Cinnamomum micranthum f. kanehirae]